MGKIFYLRLAQASPRSKEILAGQHFNFFSDAFTFDGQLIYIRIFVNPTTFDERRQILGIDVLGNAAPLYLSVQAIQSKRAVDMSLIKRLPGMTLHPARLPGRGICIIAVSRQLADISLKLVNQSRHFDFA